jgi:predicted kinase
MNIINLFVGLPGSGKTTFYEKNKALFFRGAIRISLDDFRRLIGGHQFYPNFEPFVQMWVDVTAKYLMDKKIDLVIDATNISISRRGNWISVAKMFGYEVRCWHFTAKIDTCMARDAMRADAGTMVGGKVILDMDGRFDCPFRGEGYSDLIRVDANGRIQKKSHKRP